MPEGRCPPLRRSLRPLPPVVKGSLCPPQAALDYLPPRPSSAPMGMPPPSGSAWPHLVDARIQGTPGRSIGDLWAYQPRCHASRLRSLSARRFGQFLCTGAARYDTDYVDAAEREHYVRTEPIPIERPLDPRPDGLLRRVRYVISQLLDDSEPGDFSSLAPRGTDGRRTKLFFFNGSGRGR
jgi:hypothetical protein